MSKTIITTAAEPLIEIGQKGTDIYLKADHGLYSTWSKTKDILHHAATNMVLRKSEVLQDHWTDITKHVTILPESKMVTRWQGSKIPWTLWEQICSFMRWSQKTYKAEALITLFYNTDDGRWAAWPFPQHPNGMTVCYDLADPLYQQDRRQFGRGWIQFGSVHHHCSSSAFQSGTDKTDEEDRDGLHITLGNMEDLEMSLHVRQVFESIQTDGHLFNWVEPADWIKPIPQGLRWKVFSDALKLGDPTKEFPAEWKLRVTKLEEKKPYLPPHHQHFPPGKTYPGSQPASNGNASGGAKTSGIGSQTEFPLKSKRREKIEEILAMVQLSATQAYRLISCSNPKKILDDSDKTLLKELEKMLEEEHIAILYAELILEEMTDEEVNDAAHIQHAAGKGMDHPGD